MTKIKLTGKYQANISNQDGPGHPSAPATSYPWLHRFAKSRGSEANDNSRSKLSSSSSNNNRAPHGVQNHQLRPDMANKQSNSNDDDVLVSDIIGGFGIYQLLVLLFSGLREGTVGYDTVVVSIITQPEKYFFCADTGLLNGQEIFSPGSDLMRNFDISRSECYQHESGILLKDMEGNPKLCEKFLFSNRSTTQSTTLVTEWNLVCHREYLVAIIECSYFIGLMLGNLFWGQIADMMGRWKAYFLGHVVAITFGWASVFAISVEEFIIFRFLTAFGSISYNIIYTIQVEMIGTEYRSYCTVLNHLGWGTGLLLVPLVGRYFSEYKYILAVTPTLAVIMLPWALWLPESSRWLMANGYYKRAKEELYRGARYNGRRDNPNIETMIRSLNDKINYDRQKQEMETKKTSYMLLFSSWPLVRDTLVLSLCTFVAHLLYYSLTINFGYLGDVSMNANFIISGVGELVGCIVGALMMKWLPRRLCMFFFLNVMGLSFVFQALVDMHLVPGLDNRLLSTIMNAIGTISSLTSIFIIMIVNQEVYPTVIRQTGSSLVNTIAETGSAVAPFLVNLSRVIGLVGSSALFALVSFISASTVYFLTETDGTELNDTVNQDMNNKVQRRSSVLSRRSSQYNNSRRGSRCSTNNVRRGWNSTLAISSSTSNNNNNSDTTISRVPMSKKNSPVSLSGRFDQMMHWTGENKIGTYNRLSASDLERENSCKTHILGDSRSIKSYKSITDMEATI